METSRAKQDAPPPVYLEKSRGVGQELGCSHQQGRPRGPARLSRGLNHPASPYKGGAPPGPRGPEAGDPETPGRRLGSPGQLAERCPQTRQQRPDSGAKQGWPLGGARRTRAGAQSVRTPPGLGSNPHHPPTRRPAGLTRRGGSRPAAPRGNRTAARGCHRLRWLRPRLARRPPPPAGAPHLRRAPRSHRPPAAPPPPPPAPGPSPPLRLPPQPAPPAPGSASRPRPLSAGTSGQARTGVLATRDWPLSGTPSPGSRSGCVRESRRGRMGERQPWSRLREGAAAGPRITASRPPSPRLPLLAGGGLLRGARPGLPERNG